DAADHHGRRCRQLRLDALDALAVDDREQVGAEPVDLGEEVGLAGAGDAEDGDDRGDADRDPERRQRRSGAPRADADRGKCEQVARAKLRARDHATTRPSCSATRRPAAAATSSLWVMTTSVAPWRFSSCKRATSSAPAV